MNFFRADSVFLALILIVNQIESGQLAPSIDVLYSHQLVAHAVYGEATTAIYKYLHVHVQQTIRFECMFITAIYSVTYNTQHVHYFTFFSSG